MLRWKRGQRYTQPIAAPGATGVFSDLKSHFERGMHSSSASAVPRRSQMFPFFWHCSFGLPLALNGNVLFQHVSRKEEYFSFLKAICL